MALKKEHLTTAIKAALGIGLITYVLRSRMVDFETLHAILLDPKNLVIAIFFLSFSILLSTARWYLLAKPQGLALSFSKYFSLSMIGLFFNTFMPGSVGGDLTKAWYIAGEEPERRTRAIFTVLLDRVLGLAVIIYYAAFTIIFYTEWLQNQIQLKLIATFLWTFTGGSLVFALFFFNPAVWKLPIFIRFLEFLHRNERLGKILDSALLYRNHLVPILWATLLSTLSILGINIFFWFIGNAIGIPLDLPHYFFVVPLALIVSAIPILPGGIGTGQIAFSTLFAWIGMKDPTQGATLCTVYQIYTILFNCTGALFYFRFKKKPKFNNTTSLTQGAPTYS